MVCKEAIISSRIYCTRLGEYVDDVVYCPYLTVVLAKKEVTLEFEEGKEASRSCLRLLLRKFLHREDLKEDFRVISGGENVFIVKERKEYSE